MQKNWQKGRLRERRVREGNQEVSLSHFSYLYKYPFNLSLARLNTAISINCFRHSKILRTSSSSEPLPIHKSDKTHFFVHYDIYYIIFLISLYSFLKHVDGFILNQNLSAARNLTVYFLTESYYYVNIDISKKTEDKRHISCIISKRPDERGVLHDFRRKTGKNKKRK